VLWLSPSSIRVLPIKVLEELKGTGSHVLQTFLSHEDEAKLQASLDAARSLSYVAPALFKESMNACANQTLLVDFSSCDMHLHDPSSGLCSQREYSFFR